MNRESAINPDVNFSIPEQREDHESLETSLIKVGERISNQALEVLSECQTLIETSPDSVVRQRAVDIGKKIYQKTKKTLVALNMIGMAVALGAAINYRVTRYEVDHGINEQGQDEYSHSQDPETTHALNIISGKEEFSEEEKLAFLKQNTAINCADLDISLPEGYESFTEAQLGELWAQVILPKLGASPKEIAEFPKTGWIDKMELFPKKEPYNPEIYKAIWTIEQETGAPKVRWQVRRVPQESDSSMTVDLKELSRDHYDPITNTLYVNPIANNFDELRETLISEQSHSKQANEEPIGSSIKSYVSYLRIVKTSLSEGIPLYEAQLKEYDTPGSVEYEAHKEIEPELKKKLPPVGMVKQ